jgi:PKD repeat protein
LLHSYDTPGKVRHFPYWQWFAKQNGTGCTLENPPIFIDFAVERFKKVVQSSGRSETHYAYLLFAMKPLLRLLFALFILGSASVYAGAIRNLPGFSTTVYAGNDDGTYPCDGSSSCTPIAVPIGFPINFYGNTFNNVYVNNNGNVSFDAALGDYIPFALTNSGTRMIAAYFADVDTRVGNTVTFGTNAVDGHPAFGVNWIGVGYYFENVDKLNRFQLILINRSDRNPGDFDIEFNYDQVQWETGDVGGGSGGLGGDSAVIGYSDGSGLPGTSFQLSGSGIPGRFLDVNPGGLIHASLNTNVLGRYVFPVVNLSNTVLNVTRFGQGDPPWATNTYDSSGTNIQARGCAVSCLAMALKFAGINTDPGSLNQMMISSNDFVGKNNVNWDAATRDASGSTLEFHGYRTSDAQYLNQKLSQGFPVIVGVNINSNGDAGHFVLVTGKQNGQFAIKDPGHLNATNLSAYSNIFETRGYVGDPPGNVGGLDVTVSDSADVLVADPLARLTGYDPTSRSIREAIPQSVHFSDSLESNDSNGAPGTNTARQVEIFQPLQGKYQIFLVGSNAGPYQLTLRGFTQAGAPMTPLVLSGTRESNTIVSFQVNFGNSSVTLQTFTNEAPWSATPTGGGAPLQVQFTGPSLDSGGIPLTNWYWAFGDGSTSTSQSPSHTFGAAGSYIPSLSAVNSNGAAAFSFGSTIAVSNLSLVKNGGFETGDFTNWTLTGDIDYAFVSSDFVNSGTYGASLGTFGGYGFLSQNLATTPGITYILSLWLDSPDGELPNEFAVSWNGTNLFDAVNMPAFGWTNLQFRVVATGPLTSLTFTYYDDATYLGLDDVSVQPLTFQVNSIGLSGANLIVNGNNPFVGGTYVTLMSTNPAQSLNLWTPIGTNVVATNGNFNFTVTNAVSGPRRFYILRLQ